MSGKVTFITRHYPPTPNINGEAVCDMVNYLEEKSKVCCNIICIDRQSEGGGQKRQPSGKVHRLKTISESKNIFLRFITFLYDGFRLTKEALKFKNSLIIVTSSPPLLPFWASIIFSKKIRWAFWALDLFPEGFAVTGFVSKRNPLYLWVKKKTYSASPEFLITLGPQQAEHLQQQYRKEIPSLILPCGVFFYQDKSTDTPTWNETEKIIFGYCGNVGDAHNENFIKAAIDHINPEKQMLILALYGNKATGLKEYAKEKSGVKIVENVPRDQLHFIDIHLVSLRTEWTHIAVPSKAVSAITIGKPILFCGNESSDNWFMFKKAGWFINEDNYMRDSVRDFMHTIDKGKILIKEKNTTFLYKKLKQSVLTAYENVRERIRN